MNLLLLLPLLAVITTAAANDNDGPGRFDLAVDLRGTWAYDSHEGCEAYMDITGTSHFAGGSQFCLILPNTQMATSIWQDCLEMTISGSTVACNAPLHHMILNDEYLTDDWTNAGTPASWTSKIVEAGENDVDAASPVVVFNIAINDTGTGDRMNDAFVSTGQDARRYLNSKGQLVLAWTVQADENNEAASFRIVMNKTQDLPCQEYDPTVCADRTYTDGVGAAGWTPACCLDLQEYGEFIPNPNVRGCDAADQEDETNDSTSNGVRKYYSYAATATAALMMGVWAVSW